MHAGIAHLRWRGKRSRHSWRMRTRNFAYLARGPWRTCFRYRFSVVLNNCKCKFPLIKQRYSKWPTKVCTLTISIITDFHDLKFVTDYWPATCYELNWRCTMSLGDLPFEGLQSKWISSQQGHQILQCCPSTSLAYLSPVASFTKEFNSRLAKRPLIVNGRLANRGLTSFVKEVTGV